MLCLSIHLEAQLAVQALLPVLTDVDSVTKVTVEEGLMADCAQPTQGHLHLSEPASDAAPSDNIELTTLPEFIKVVASMLCNVSARNATDLLADVCSQESHAEVGGAVRSSSSA